VPKRPKIFVPPRTDAEMPQQAPTSLDAEADAMMQQMGLQVDPEQAAENERLKVKDYLSRDGDMGPEVQKALMDEVAQEVQLEQQYGDRAPEAFLGEAANAATLGLSDQLLTKTGMADPQALKQIRERSPLASTAGTVAGVVAPLMVPGAGALTPIAGVAKAGGAVERITAKSLEGLAAATGRKKIAAQILAKIAPTAAAGGIEGAAMSLGQLISEEALGDAKFNAENVVASMGTGTLLGTAGGALFGAAKATVPTIAKGAGAIATRGRKYFEHVVDPIEAAKAQSGLTKSKIISIEQQHPDFFGKLPAYFREHLGVNNIKGAFQSADELATKNAQIVEQMGHKIGAFSRQLDEITTREPHLRPTRAETFDPLIDSLSKRHSDLLKAGEQANLQEIKTLERFVTDLYEMKLRNAPMKFKELDDLRKSYQKLAYRGRIDPARSFEGETANELRGLLRKQVDFVADRVSAAGSDPATKAIATELRKANEAFHIGRTVEKSMLIKAGKTSMLSPTEVIEAAALQHVGGAAGLITGAVKKFLRTDAARNLAILADVEKQKLVTQSRIQDALKSFVTKSAKVSRPASLRVLIDSRFSDDKDGNKPKNKQAAFANLRDNLAKYETDSEQLVNRMAKATHIISKAAPITAVEVQNTLVAAMSFLSSKIPKQENILAETPWSRPYEPSNFELSKFERYLQVIEAPLSVLDDLESNSLTREHVEALQAVYPSIYAEVRNTAMETATAAGPKLAYGKKVQLSILLDLPTDASLQGANVMGLQANFAQPEDSNATGAPAVQPTAGGMQKLDGANRAQTETQRVASRGQS
jgi:hypothetical protein